MRALPAAVLVPLVCAPAAAFAAERTASGNATYVMGDSDTRAQAIELCIAKIERRALEASGTLVESELEMISDENRAGGVSDSAHQRVRSYVGAVVRATATHETFRVDGERILVDCNATVSFDPDEVKERLRAARTDDTTKAKVDQQQAQIAALESELQELRAKLAQRPAQVVSQQQPPLPPPVPAQQIVWRQPPAPAPAIPALPAAMGQVVTLAPSVTISTAAYAARLRKIRPGMSEVDLVSFVGNPRASVHEFERVYSWNYGTTWVTMNDAAVACVSLRENPLCAPAYLLR